MAKLKVAVGPNDHVQGGDETACTVVEYGDYECPHCGHAHPIVKRLQKHFGDRLRFVFRNFPLNEIHANAESAAETAEFAGAQGKFWEMHDLLFENQPSLGDALYIALAEELKLSTAKLQDALAKNEYLPRVRTDFTSGARSGVNGTPTFFINGERHDDSFEYEVLLNAIEAASGK